MSAAGAILSKDWREALRDRRVVVMALIVLALGLTAVLASWQRVAAHEQERVAALAQDTATWEAQGARNPHSAAHFAKWALRPLTAGALLDPGVSPFAGSAIWMEAHSQNPARARPAEDRADTLLAGEFSTAWILQVLMPLLVAVIAAGAVARERERGTLRLLLASGASAAAILRGKLASVGVITGLVAGSVLVLGFLASLMAGGAQPLHLLLWASAYLLYLAIIACIAVAVSARARTTGQALLVLTGLWLFAIVLVPRAGASAVEVAAPTPAPDRFWTEMGEAQEERPDPFGADAEAFGQEMTRKYGVASVEDLPVDLGGLQLEESERQGNIVFDRFYGDLHALYLRQRKLLRWSNLLSPLPALQNVSAALAGTDGLHQIAFQNQAEAHRRAMVTQLNTDLIEHGREAGWDYAADPSFWATIADFRFVPPATGAVLRSIAIDAAILLAWLAAALFVLARSVRGLRVEEA